MKPFMLDTYDPEQKRYAIALDKIFNIKPYDIVGNTYCYQAEATDAIDTLFEDPSLTTGLGEWAPVGENYVRRAPKLIEFYKNYSEKPMCGWFNGYDRMTGGIYIGDTIVVGGETNSGKTLMAINALQHFSTITKTAYISTETSKASLLSRYYQGYTLSECIKRDNERSYVILDGYNDAKENEDGKVYYFYPDTYDITDSNIIILDYLKLTDSADAVDGSRSIRELVDSWRKYCAENGKTCILFCQLKDWSTNVWGNYTTNSDFWVSTSMTQPATVVMAMRHIDKDGTNNTVAVDIIKNKHYIPDAITQGRFIMGTDMITNEVIFCTEAVKPVEAPEIAKSFRKAATK